MSGMIFFIDEELIKRDLRKAEKALRAARQLRAKGVSVPEFVFSKVENVIEELETRLFELVEKNDE